MNNLAWYEVKGVRDGIEVAAASVMLIPPNSPKLDPIKLAMG